MNEILLYPFAIATALGIRAILDRGKKKEGEGVPVSAETGARVSDDKGARVFEILRRVYLDMKEQRGAGYGPWLSSALEHRCGDPAVALTAVRWTLRDIQKQPVGEGVGYVPGLKFRFDLSGLLAAERELEEMKEGLA